MTVSRAAEAILFIAGMLLLAVAVNSDAILKVWPL